MTVWRRLPRFSFTILLGGLILAYSSLTSAAAPGALPRLRVSPNSRFLVTEDGRPFFWLGDTSWGMMQKSRREDSARQPSILKYFANRQAKGFNVLQCKIVGLGPDRRRWLNAYGHEAFAGGDFTRPRVIEGPDNDYWDYADWFVDQAGRHGIYLAWLPTWGDEIKNDTPLAKDPRVAYRYGHFLGSRYGSRTHIIWVLGGDPAPQYDVENPIRMTMTRAIAEGIADGANGIDKQDGKADFSTTMMTYHPRGGGQSSSAHLHEEPWLDFNMIQTTTRFNFTNYVTVAADYAKTPPKPTLDAEVAYEASLSLWRGKGEPDEIRTKPWEVRKAAYWNVFAGGFGFTYGHRSFIAFCLPGEKLNHGAYIPWFESLDAPGAFQMIHLKRLMESHPFLTRIPDQSVIASGAGEGMERAVATRDAEGTCAMVYLPTGRPVTVKLDSVKGAKVSASWFDPRTGKTEAIGEYQGQGTREFKPPTSGKDNDWVLVISKQ